MQSLTFAATLALSASCVAFALASCTTESTDPPPEQVGTDESSIIGGQLDTTHTAVVAVLGNNFSCSGTIVQVKNGVGYVLTAAHCCNPSALPKWIVAASDYNINFNPQTPAPPVYLVTPGSVKVDSCYLDYAGSTDDVCMLKFSDATGLPTIPAAAPSDGLMVGTNVTYVGYGLTSSPPSGQNSKRRTVTKPIGYLDTYFIEYANPGASGTCEGDSGGPGIATVGSVDKVVGVTSYGDQGCTQLGASIRVTSVYTHFIAPYLADTPMDPPTCPVDTDCQQCGDYAEQQGGCTNAVSACLNDSACNALLMCYQPCTTQACINACNTANVGGLAKYVALENCVCDTACTSACATATYCTQPMCGLKVSDATCKDCVEQKCCADAWSCQQDTTCKKCFGTSPPADCQTNALAETYYQCATSQCGCALPDPANAGTTSSSAVTSGAGGSGAGGAPDSGAATTGSGAGGGKGKVTPEQGGCSMSAGSNDDLRVGALFALVALATARSRRRRA